MRSREIPGEGTGRLHVECIIDQTIQGYIPDHPIRSVSGSRSETPGIPRVCREMAADTADNHMIWLIDFVIIGLAHISCLKGATCDSRTVDIASSHATLIE